MDPLDPLDPLDPQAVDPQVVGPQAGLDSLEQLEPLLPAPYRVAFSTRAGGTSDGPYASLNVGLTVGDEPERVIANRRLLAAAVGFDPARAELAFLEHGSLVREARPVGILDPERAAEPCDGLWTDQPGLALLVAVADCLPVALWRAAGRSPGIAVLHCGWRGLVSGVVAAGVSALGAGALEAVVGPGIGPCCYEVGPEVAAPFTEAFGADVVQARAASLYLDLRLAATRALTAAGVTVVGQLDRCVACEQEHFFSHRRDQGRTGRQAVVALIDA